MKELQRKRHSATPGVSLKGRVRKVAKWKPASDDESDEDSESEFIYILIYPNLLKFYVQINLAAFLV